MEQELKFEDLALRDWVATDATASAPEAGENTATVPKEEASGEIVQPTIPPEVEERLRALEEKVKEADWAFKINEIAQQNPQIAAQILRKAAEIYEGAKPSEQPASAFDFQRWFTELEQLVQSPPVDPEWMSEEAKWMHKVAQAIVEGLKNSYIQSQQFWQQFLEQQKAATEEEAVKAALDRAEQELTTLKERLGAAWNESVEKKILEYMDKVAEEEDRLIFPLEAYGRLVAEGQLPPPTAVRRLQVAPPALMTTRSAPGVAMRSRQRPASIDEAVKSAFQDYGIPLE